MKNEILTEKESNYGNIIKRYLSLNRQLLHLDNNHKIRLAQAGFHFKGMISILTT
jgi:hypothetical protein